MDQNVAERSPLSAEPDRGASWLPQPMPLAMPVQDLDAPVTASVAHDPAAERWRLAVFGAAGLLTMIFAWQLHSVLSFGRLQPLQFLFLALSTVAFAWVALSSVSALVGTLKLAIEGGAGLALPPVGPVTTRTALLFPVYHEPPERIAGTIEAMSEELRALAVTHNFDVFVLSDSRNDAAGDLEARVFRVLSDRLEPHQKIYYRRRSDNVGRKAGNIADWIRRFGGGYETFIVLDADSVMSGELLVRLTRAMEARPSAGLIQTVPALIGSSTLFQHLQQFASRAYGPGVAAGLASWHGTEGNYWGHNAIVRTRAFAAGAGLPVLQGKPPFGGHILSHDFVEAALLQRAGWQVLMSPPGQGSYEGCPPTIADHIVRDRRWAQGNLQHLMIVIRRGLTAMGRMHLAMGVAAYLASLLWAASLAVGLLLAVASQHDSPSYFPNGKSLFPSWPMTDPAAAIRLLLGTLLVLLLPRLVAIGIGLVGNGGRRKQFLAGAGLELLVSVLLAPILMISQTRSVIEILRSKDAGWRPQRRISPGLTLSEATMYALPYCLVGLLVTGACLSVSLDIGLWMSPVLAGLVLSGPLIWITSRPPGAAVRRVLETEGDRELPPVVRQTESRAAAWARGLNQDVERPVDAA